VCPCPQCIGLGRPESLCKLSWNEWEEMGNTKRFFCETCSEFVEVGLSSDEKGGEEVVSLSGTLRKQDYTRRVSLRDNTEEDVGELWLDNVADPRQEWPMSEVPYFFLSHTGRDGVKEEIAHPTYWFLKRILGVEAFLDDSDAIRGNTVMEALVPPSYECTHALVIVSPTFRQRSCCVRELNTFMARWRRRDGIRVIPALWLLNNLDGYHPDVDDLIRIGNGGTRYCVSYLVKNLWPELVRMLGRPAIATELLEEYLVEYVKFHTGTRDIPADLETFAKMKGADDDSRPTSESMPSESSGCSIL